MAKEAAQARTCWTSAVISVVSRWGLMTPPSHSRLGAAMAIACHTR